MHQPASAELCVADGLHQISRSWYEAPDYPNNSIDHSYKQIVGQPLKNVRTFCATRKCSQKSATHPYLDPDESTHTLTPCLYNVHFNIILPPLSTKCLLVAFSYQDASLDDLSLTCYVPAHHTVLDLVMLIMFCEE